MNLKRAVVQRGRRWLQLPATLVTHYEFRRQQRYGFKRHNERAVEFAFVFRSIAELAPRTVLDVGTGKTSLPHLMWSCGAVVTAIDNISDYWTKGMINRHWHVIDDDIRRPRTVSGQFDLVTCVSVLEHIVPADVAVAGMFKLVKPGGHLIITTPFHAPDHVDGVYKLPGSRGENNPYPAQSHGTADVERWLEAHNAEIVRQEFWRFWTGTHWTEGTPIFPPQPSTADAPHQLTCLLLRKRA